MAPKLAACRLVLQYIQQCLETAMSCEFQQPLVSSLYLWLTREPLRLSMESKNSPSFCQTWNCFLRFPFLEKRLWSHSTCCSFKRNETLSGTAWNETDTAPIMTGLYLERSFTVIFVCDHCFWTACWQLLSTHMHTPTSPWRFCSPCQCRSSSVWVSRGKGCACWVSCSDFQALICLSV